MVKEIEELKKIYAKLKGQIFYYIEEKPIYTEKRLHGGWDHLGPLPDVIIPILVGEDKKVKKIKINENNLHILLEEEIFKTQEDAEWKILIEESKRLKEEVKK